MALIYTQYKSFKIPNVTLTLSSGTLSSINLDTSIVANGGFNQ